MPPATTAKRRAAPAGDSRRERNKRDKQNRIIGAARALFQSQGYQQTTLGQIAAAAGVGTGTLFLYASSKEDLVILVFLDEMSDVVESSFRRRAPTAPVQTQLLDFLHGIIEYHAQDLDIARTLMRELTFLSNPDRADSVTQVADAIIARIRTILDWGVAQGEIDLERTDLVSQILFSVYFQQQQAWLSEFLTREQLEHNLVNMLRYLLRSNPHEPD